jgi:hypothetical protein
MLTRRFPIAAACLASLISAACDDAAPMSAPPDAALAATTAGMMSGAAGTTSNEPPPTPSVDSGPVVPSRDLDASAGPDASDASGPSDEDEDDAGVPEPSPTEPTCDANVWVLAQGFRLSQPVDYVADRDLSFGPSGDLENGVISSRGTPCATATDRVRCEAALKLPVNAGRHLVTTAGDTVKVWDATTARTIFGALDTKAEVIWFLTQAGGVIIPCTVSITESATGYLVEGFALDNGCGDPGPPYGGRLTVEPNALVMIVEISPVTDGCAGEPIP